MSGGHAENGGRRKRARLEARDETDLIFTIAGGSGGKDGEEQVDLALRQDQERHAQPLHQRYQHHQLHALHQDRQQHHHLQHHHLEHHHEHHEQNHHQHQVHIQHEDERPHHPEQQPGVFESGQHVFLPRDFAFSGSAMPGNPVNHDPHPRGVRVHAAEGSSSPGQARIEGEWPARGDHVYYARDEDAVIAHVFGDRSSKHTEQVRANLRELSRERQQHFSSPTANMSSEDLFEMFAGAATARLGDLINQRLRLDGKRECSHEEARHLASVYLGAEVLGLSLHSSLDVLAKMSGNPQIADDKARWIALVQAADVVELPLQPEGTLALTRQFVASAFAPIRKVFSTRHASYCFHTLAGRKAPCLVLCDATLHVVVGLWCPDAPTASAPTAAAGDRLLRELDPKPGAVIAFDDTAMPNLWQQWAARGDSVLVRTAGFAAPLASFPNIVHTKRKYHRLDETLSAETLRRESASRPSAPGPTVFLEKGVHAIAALRPAVVLCGSMPNERNCLFASAAPSSRHGAAATEQKISAANILRRVVTPYTLRRRGAEWDILRQFHVTEASGPQLALREPYLRSILLSNTAAGHAQPSAVATLLDDWLADVPSYGRAADAEIDEVMLWMQSRPWCLGAWSVGLVVNNALGHVAATPDLVAAVHVPGAAGHEETVPVCVLSGEAAFGKMPQGVPVLGTQDEAWWSLPEACRGDALHRASVLGVGFALCIYHEASSPEAFFLRFPDHARRAYMGALARVAPLCTWAARKESGAGVPADLQHVEDRLQPRAHIWRALRAKITHKAYQDHLHAAIPPVERIASVTEVCYRAVRRGGQHAAAALLRREGAPPPPLGSPRSAPLVACVLQALAQAAFVAAQVQEGAETGVSARQQFVFDIVVATLRPREPTTAATVSQAPTQRRVGPAIADKTAQDALPAQAGRMEVAEAAAIMMKAPKRGKARRNFFDSAVPRSIRMNRSLPHDIHKIGSSERHGILRHSVKICIVCGGQATSICNLCQVPLHKVLRGSDEPQSCFVRWHAAASVGQFAKPSRTGSR